MLSAEPWLNEFKSAGSKDVSVRPSKPWPNTIWGVEQEPKLPMLLELEVEAAVAVALLLTMAARVVAAAAAAAEDDETVTVTVLETVTVAEGAAQVADAAIAMLVATPEEATEAAPAPEP